MTRQDDMISWAHFYDEPLSWTRHIHTSVIYWKLLWNVLRTRPRRVIEVGTGSGTLSIFLSRIVPSLVSLDFSAGILCQAEDNNRRMKGRLNLVRGDAFNLPFETSSFDVCFSAGVLEHFDDADVVRALSEQLRVAHRVVFSVPNAAYGRQDFGNERLLSRDAWDALVRASGARLAMSCDYGQPNRYPWRSRKIHYLAIAERHPVPSPASALS